MTTALTECSPLLKLSPANARRLQGELPHIIKLLHSFIMKNILHFNKKRIYVRKQSFTNLEVFLPGFGVRMS